MALQIVKDSIDLGIVTKQVEPMVKFYRDTLGFVPDGEMDLPGGSKMTRLKCGTTVVKLVVQGREPRAEAPPGGLAGATGYRYWTVTISNLDEAAKTCADGGYNLPVPPTEIRPGIRIAMVEDPDGNWVELLEVS
ncbi:MAG TPA: VOC family protein [Pseudomonadales bacterium]|nr:VOC family protein [Pseudomonadales bacterium]